VLGMFPAIEKTLYREARNKLEAQPRRRVDPENETAEAARLPPGPLPNHRPRTEG
jgi:hypothetical protein